MRVGKQVNCHRLSCSLPSCGGDDFMKQIQARLHSLQFGINRAIKLIETDQVSGLSEGPE